MSASPYLTAAEAAQHLRFASARALYKALTYGVTNDRGDRIPVLHRGRTLLFDRDALDAWLHGEAIVGRSWRSAKSVPFHREAASRGSR